MKRILIHPPQAFYGQGQRSYNEDYIYPELGRATADDSLYIVCDGVGGGVKGDFASGMVCSHMPAYVKNHPDFFNDEANFTEENAKAFISKAIRYAEGEMDKLCAEKPEFKGMATTLTYLQFTPFGAVIAWVGDSRVYHFRNGHVLNVTEDHSLVNQLVKNGSITAEEAKTHPKRNVIVRAITGGHNPAEPDVLLIPGVKEGDHFLLCSDGVLEALSETDFEGFLSGSIPLPQAAREMEKICETNSRDNYSLYLIQIQAIQTLKAAPLPVEKSTAPPIEKSTSPPPKPFEKKPGFFDWIRAQPLQYQVTGAVVILFIAVFMFIKPFSGPELTGPGSNIGTNGNNHLDTLPEKGLPATIDSSEQGYASDSAFVTEPSKPKKPVEDKPKPPVNEPKPTSTFHTVVKGETLYGISKKYNTTTEQIKKLNEMSSNDLAEGQKLRIK